MGRDLDTRFSQLLEGIAKHENITVEMLGKTFASKEIENRRTFYPQLKQVLLQQELDIAEFKKIITNCWASGSRFDLIQFGRFTKEEDAAEVLIQTLIKDFPRNDAEAAARIDAYITDAVRLGYQDKKGSPNGSAAAALCSVLLTALFPERFVDYRQSRWRDFARKVGYDIPFPATGSYGLGIVWAGQFAADLAGTRTFKRIWNGENPLWAVAGIAWVLPGLKLGEIGPVEMLPQPLDNARSPIGMDDAGLTRSATFPKGKEFEHRRCEVRRTERPEHEPR